MESKLTKLMLDSRADYELVVQHINLKNYSKEFSIIQGFIKDYYDRDSKAERVNTDLLVDLISASVQNEKHVERFKEFVEEALATDISAANVKEVVLQAKKQEMGNELAIAIVNGKEHDALLKKYNEIMDFTDLDELLEKGVEVYDASSLDDLIEHETDPASKLQVYPLALNERLDGGLQGSDHLTLIARPEMGKTGLILTMAGGFARQGAVGIVFNNEERVTRLRLRALSSVTGMTATEIRANPQAAKDIAEQMGYHNIIFVSMSPGTPRQIEAFVERYKAKWFIVDQLRHLAVKSDTRTNQLEEAANAMRNIAKRSTQLPSLSHKQATARKERLSSIWEMLIPATQVSPEPVTCCLVSEEQNNRLPKESAPCPLVKTKLVGYMTPSQFDSTPASANL